AALAAGSILLGGIAIGGSPADAAPGDARTAGVTADVDVTLLGNPLLAVDGELGSAWAPPSGTFNTAGVSLGVPGTALVSAGVINLEANSAVAGVNGESEVTGVRVSVPLID